MWTAGLVTGRSLVLRLLLVVALGAGLSAMHVLAAVLGHQHTSGPTSARSPVHGSVTLATVGDHGHLSAQAGPAAGAPTAVQVGARVNAQVTAQVTDQVTAQVTDQVSDHEHHAIGECVLFLSAGIAVLVVLVAWAAAQALRPSYWLTEPWLQKLTASTPWRGPPPWHWPRISLCVIRV